MKKWFILLLIIGIALLLASFFIYASWIGYCYPATLPERSPEQVLQFQQDCGQDANQVRPSSGFLALFIAGVLLVTTYWLVRPPKANIPRKGPLASFLMLTLFECLLLVLLALLSYPDINAASGKVALVMAGFGFISYIAILGIWQWKRWGLLLFQAVTVLLTIYTGLNGISYLLAVVAIFSAIFLTLILR
ncbi:MAG: hypothetical protein NTW99_04890, partial [Chloroflexi bacterium]|nr:hypothetical protein [Chloroflexota bacterium]